MEERKETIDAAVKSVQFISTGHVEQHLEHRYGTSKPLMWWVLTSKSWIKVPIGVFIIVHREGVILFDAGLDPAIAEPDYIDSPIGRYLLGKIFRIHIGPDDALGKQLEAMEIPADSVRKAIISHLHFDHIGGIADIPQAELLVSKEEWQRLSEPRPERDWFLREHIELPGAKWHQIDFSPTDDPLLKDFGECYDVIGDGSLVLLPTPGHTAGSMSLLIRSAGMPPMLLVGDLTYELDLLLNDQFPGVGDKVQLKASFAKVRALKTRLPDLLILPSHDHTAADNLRRGLSQA